MSADDVKEGSRHRASCEQGRRMSLSGDVGAIPGHGATVLCPLCGKMLCGMSWGRR